MLLHVGISPEGARGGLWLPTWHVFFLCKPATPSVVGSMGVEACFREGSLGGWGIALMVVDFVTSIVDDLG